MMKTQEMQDHNNSLNRWDNYFYEMCKVVASNSQCLSRKIGAILVDDKRVVGCGYNGPPSGVPHCGKRYLIDPVMREHLKSLEIDPDNDGNYETCPRYVMGFKSGEGLEWCVAGHAERNALINAARTGIKTKDCKVYMSCGVPCSPCCVELINAGVEEIIITEFTFYDVSSQYLLEHTNMNVRMFTHFCEHKNIIPKSIVANERIGFCSDCGMYLGV